MNYIIYARQQVLQGGFSMKRIVYFGFLLTLLLGWVVPAVPVGAASSAPQTYTVMVGAEDPAHGVDVEGYFPALLHIHPGDKVNWVLKSYEIHTVTFLAGANTVPELMVPLPKGPQGAMMLNPQVAFPSTPKDGMYGGASYANSGIMGRDPGQSQQFSLTFTAPGTYAYRCVVHGKEDMLGTIVVDPASTTIPSPADIAAQTKGEMDKALAKGPEAIKAAKATMKAPEKNADGSTTYYISVGYAHGQIDLQGYFPHILEVRRGDTVVWTFNQADIAPHTITFLNGAEIPPLVIPQPQPNGPPLLALNPAVVLPQNADKSLTNRGVFNSGLIDPAIPGPLTFSIKIGDVSGVLPVLKYQCLLHDDAGMVGMLIVVDK
jgi:plastocyanin